MVRGTLFWLLAGTLFATAAVGCATKSVCGDCEDGLVCNLTTRQCEAAVPDAAPGTRRFEITVELRGAGTGLVVSQPAGISCGDVCSLEILEGETIALEATAGADSDFAGWSGEACRGNKACEFIVERDYTVVAAFETGPCDAATNTCVAAPPASWQGPVALYDADSPESPPSCAGTAFPTQVSADGAGGELQTSGGCVCPDCTLPADAECVGFSAENRATCGGAVREDRGLGADGQCNFIDTIVFGTDDIYFIPPPTVRTEGSCQPGEPATDYDASFSRFTIACGDSLARGTGCAAGELCIPRVDSPFRQGLCIYQSGEHECPINGPYEDRLLRYESVDDGRQCACDSCVDYDRTECTETTVKFWTGMCTGQSDTYSVNECRTSVLATAPRGATVDPGALPACASGPPNETGDVELVGPTTFCCLP